MAKRQKKTKSIFMKFLKANRHRLKNLDKKKHSVKYNREPWMLRSNPPMDEGEENIRQEAESYC